MIKTKPGAIVSGFICMSPRLNLMVFTYMVCSPFNVYFYTCADLKLYRLQGCSQFNEYPWSISGYVSTKPLIGKIKEGFPD